VVVREQVNDLVRDTALLDKDRINPLTISAYSRFQKSWPRDIFIKKNVAQTWAQNTFELDLMQLFVNWHDSFFKS
jgi:hypothetical protein